MSMITLIWGILSLLGLIVFFLPCLGSLNWLNIPFSGIGLIIGAIAISKAEKDKKSLATIGTVLCAIAVVIGALRLAMGGGIL
jgi:hypothetical protein